MKRRGLYRKGIDVSNIFNFYSSEIGYKRKEFNENVIPWIRIYFNDHRDLYMTTNRNGTPVWKLKE